METSKVEDMLSQLIRMVGTLQSDVQAIKVDMQEMKAEMQEMKADIQKMKLDIERIESTSERRHTIVMKELRALKIDQDFVWEKSVRNEREIEQLKGKIS